MSVQEVRISVAASSCRADASLKSTLVQGASADSNWAACSKGELECKFLLLVSVRACNDTGAGSAADSLNDFEVEIIDLRC